MSNSNNFISERKYKIWMYTVSHSTLILRSEKQYFDVEYDFQYEEPNSTIDVIFTSVDFISIPDFFDRLEIIKEVNMFIFNGNINWFVKATNCCIGKYEGNDNMDFLNNLNNYSEIIEL